MTQPALLSTRADEDDPTPPKRVSIYPEWMDLSVCSGMDDTLFFGASDPNERPQFTLTQIKEARKLCAKCPVARICLQTSLENRDEYGVFAGSTRTDRAKMLMRITTGITSMNDEINQFLTWLKESAK